jgi:TolB-like protein/DNA-binding winged helix-turn-helix (wHTH) protein/lipopolysaccharide biosynthesis regulator YciM
VLLLDGNEIALRPKTFAVLCHLAKSGGRLVSKEELFPAVWPGVVVTDDALVQSIGELRRAFGGDGARLITTIPRRGYRFEPAVSAEGEPPALAPPAARPAIRRVRAAFALGVTLLVAAGLLWIIEPSWLGGAQKPARTTAAIAVLPFQNQSGDRARQYFADGVTQDLINALGRFPELTVMSWNAVAPYKASPAGAGEIAHQLSVNYQVEGSVLRTADRVRVTAQLVSADGRVLWSERFDEPLGDLFALEDRMTAEIAGALAIRVNKMEERRASSKPAESLDAYDYVLRARPALQRPTRANNVEARALLRRALQADPSLAAAHAALAEVYHIGVAMGWAESPADSLGQAEALANNAVALDRSLARAHVTLGRVHIFHQRYEQAQHALERALAANPSDAHALAGRGNVLMWMGRIDAAIEALERAQRIDPDLNAIDRFALSLAYYTKGRYQAAAEQAQSNLRETNAANFSRVILAAAYAQLGRAEDARHAVAAIHRASPGFDAAGFGSKFLNRKDFRHLQEGLEKAGFPSAS